MEASALEPARECHKTCQIDGCIEMTVGSRTALCRKHRNNKYKQNYKKKKRKAQGMDELQSESIENQLAEEKCFMEQKYASMLQQVLVQKQLELLQSEKVIQVLRNHQQKVKENKVREIQERRRTAAQDEQQPQKERTKKEALAHSSPSTNDCIGSSRCKSPAVLAKDCKVGPGNVRVGKGAKNPAKEQTRKNAGRASTLKDARAENNFAMLGNMTHISIQPQHGVSDLGTKTVSLGARISTPLGVDNGGYGRKNICITKGPQHPVGSNQAVCMQGNRQSHRIDNIYSYQPNIQPGNGGSSTFTKACIDSVKHLSIGAGGATFLPATAVVSSSAVQPRPTPRNIKEGTPYPVETNPYSQHFVRANSKGVAEHVYTRMPQGVLSNPATCKAIAQNGSVLLQADERQPSFQHLVTSCASTVGTTRTGGNTASTSAGLAGVTQQTLMSLPLTTFSHLPVDQTFTVGTNMAPPQTSQGLMPQHWSNQMTPGRLRAQSSQDDFLLHMLQGEKDAQVQLGSPSHTSTVIGRLDHVIPDSPWTMSIGM